MLIERIDIESFGMLKNLHVTINNRINVFYGSNESGKSMIAAFIKFMLFGYSGEKSPVLSENERKLYTPWDKNKVAGSMIVHFKDRKYKIEREYSDSSVERTRLIDLSTNIVLQNEEEPGEFFFKMSEEVFVKTAFLKQFDTSEIGGEGLADMIQNILFTADEDINSQKTLRRLQDAKDILLFEDKETGVKSGAIFNISKKRDDLKKSLQNSISDQKELIRMEGMIKDLEEKMLTHNAKQNELNDELENYKAYNASQELQKIESARKQAERLKENVKKVIARNSHGDFIPDMNYSRELMDISARVGEKKDKLQGYTEQRNISSAKYGDAVEKNKNFKVIENAGGVDSVGDEYDRLKQSQSIFKLFKFICAALVFVSAAGISALYFLDIYKNIALYGFSALFAVMTALFVFLEKNKRNGIEAFYSSFDFKNETDFAYVLDDYPDTEAQLEILRSDLEECESMVMDAEKEFDGVYSEARELLLKWNRTPESDDKSPEDFIKYAKAASEAAEEIQKARVVCEQNQIKLDAMLEGCDEKELRKLAAAARKPNYDEKQIAKELDFISKASESMREKEGEIGKNIATISAKMPDPVILESQINFLEERIDELTARYNALQLATDTLVLSCNELRNSIAPRLSESAGNLFKLLTGDKYEDFISDKFFGVEITQPKSDGAKRDLTHFSAGTRDAAYLCMRMALLDLLFESEMPPLICDESFSNLDSRRLDNLLKVIASMSKKTQVFIFTCHEREANAFRATDAVVMNMPGDYAN
ncbi:MAG: AAA family ATPase [Oscillospiraceae bacterium]|nr:AAA family ATPase [Oscillospiraceae bacterium]